MYTDIYRGDTEQDKPFDLTPEPIPKVSGES